MRVEGIVIQKTPFKEKDIICHMLLRSGKTIPVYIYGGRGGGKKSKGSIVETGFMLKMELQRQKKTLDSPMHIAKEYSLIWSSDTIRNNYHALCLQSFYLELVAKMTVSDDLDHQDSLEHAGIFNVLSNALFFLDDSLQRKDFHVYNQLFMFFTKLIIQLGITPDIDHCLYCAKELKRNEMCLFLPHEGGFSCHECQTQKDEFLSDNRLLLEEFNHSGLYRENLKNGFLIPYKEYQKLPVIDQSLVSLSFHYLNYQFELKSDQFKTWKLL